MDSRNNSPFHYAIKAESKSFLEVRSLSLTRTAVRWKFLMDAKAFLLPSRSSVQKSLLLQMICKAPGASKGINQRNVDGETPLRAACVAGLTACVEVLLRQGADVNSASFSQCQQEPRSLERNYYVLLYFQRSIELALSSKTLTA